MVTPIKMIVAQSINSVIGRDGDIPWHLPTDLMFFRKITEGNVVVMGRHTFESIGRPLPNRKNIVLTRNPRFQHEGIETVTNIDQLIQGVRDTQRSGECVYVIGGEAVYRYFLPHADVVYMTLVDTIIDGDASFPRMTGEWNVEMIEQHVEKPNRPLRGDWFPHRMYKLTRRARESEPGEV